MGSESSDQVLALLKELAVLKEKNQHYEANPSEAERDEYRVRQLRHEEIAEEIKALAESKKSDQGP
jgi:hypothetical protein